jgi:hypothetical protein
MSKEVIVLNVAEKPSVAKSIVNVLTNNKFTYVSSFIRPIPVQNIILSLHSHTKFMERTLQCYLRLLPGILWKLIIHQNAEVGAAIPYWIYLHAQL